MALLLRDLTLGLEADEVELLPLAARQLGLAPSLLHDFRIVRRSIDARRKGRILRVFSVIFRCDDEARLLAADRTGRLVPYAEPVEPPLPRLSVPLRVLVVGMGPAGLFAARRLAETGAQVTLVERGRPLRERVADVEAFWRGGRFDALSNVQFGEGGAGTFSDGKLTSRLNNPRRMAVLEALVACGAPRDILVEAHPHIGSDRLRKVVLGFRQQLLAAGVEIRFEACLTGLETCRGKVCGGVLNDRELLPCDALVLAPGHSARDTYRMLDASGVHLAAKSFAVGVRVEHPAQLINRIQYGAAAPGLPTAEYSLRYSDKDSGRGVYSFCMCPGGEVINAASEEGGLVVNGMSQLARDGRWSNSALVVTVGPDDWGGSALGGMRFQQEWERRAFVAGGGTYFAPAQNLLTFLGRAHAPLASSCRPGVSEAELREVLPAFVYDSLRLALPHFDRRMRGFVTAEATMIGVETRTSAPLRIVRGESGESLSHAGLFPAGEGAGYAGGIMSAALDGLRTAELVVQAAAS
jgi:uncharacterized FAD-dependent dehydrogenase